MSELVSRVSEMRRSGADVGREVLAGEGGEGGTATTWRTTCSIW